MNSHLLGYPVTEINFREFVKDVKSREHYTQEIHSYPGKLIHHIPNYFISELSKEKEIVLDPFCGTGTVLVESRLNSRNSCGYEINPLSRLISRVKTTPLNIEEVKEKNLNLLAKYEELNGNITIPDFPNRDFWFDYEHQYDLTKILLLINQIKDIRIKEFFQVCFSSIIRKVSFADPRISPAVKSKNRLMTIKNKGLPSVLQVFKETFYLNLERIKKFSERCDWQCYAEINGTDARKINLKDESIDLVITSPPYINAQKYVRATKLEIFWLGLLNDEQLKKLDFDLIGTEKVYAKDYTKLHNIGCDSADQIVSIIYNKDPRLAFIAYKFYFDMTKVIKEVYRVLKKGKFFVLIIGNNTIKGINVPNQKVLTEIAIENGFTIKDIFVDYIKSYGLMTKRNKTADMIDKEWVIIFKK